MAYFREENQYKTFLLLFSSHLHTHRSTAQTPIFSFCPLTEVEVSKLLFSSHPTTCPLDKGFSNCGLQSRTRWVAQSHLAALANRQRAHCKYCSILQVCTSQHQKDQALSNEGPGQEVVQHAPLERGSKSLSRTFYFTVPGRWNDLPTPIRNTGSLSIFKQQLKTHLFQLYLTT